MLCVVSFNHTDYDKLKHDFDPLSSLFTIISNSSFIKNGTTDMSFLVPIIVQYVGYVETTLNIAKYGVQTYNCRSNNVEQVFIISLPNSTTSKYQYNYTLKSFATEIELNTIDPAQICATLIELKLKQNDHDVDPSITSSSSGSSNYSWKEKILWQSQMYNVHTAPYCFKKRKDKYNYKYNANYNINENRRDDEHFVYKVFDKIQGQIIKFDNINIELESNDKNGHLKNEKLYLIQIDVPDGTSCCQEARVDFDQHQAKKKWLVNTDACLHQNVYKMRQKNSCYRKFYEISFI